MASAPFSTAARAHSQSPAGARSSGRAAASGSGGPPGALAGWMVASCISATANQHSRGKPVKKATFLRARAIS